MRLELPDAWKKETRNVLVTGCAGFLGSTLVDALLEQGHDVVGIDCFSDYYDPELKRHHLAGAAAYGGFRLIEADLNQLDLAELLEGVNYCFHFAAQAGVRASWGSEFNIYLESNIHATQRLLEAIVKVRGESDDFRRLIYSSSSSVYGNQDRFPVVEDVDKRPFSPYGVSKLAAEQLCALYAENFGVECSSLRYFTVYGPRQRPDMAFRKFLDAARRGEPWKIYGDGEQTRDFTFVTDAIHANLLAADDPSPYGVYNIGGGSRIALKDALAILRDRAVEHGIAKEIRMEHVEMAKGDVRHTYADGTRAREALGFVAKVPLEAGLDAEASWVAANLL
jgi:nucleoside-diphosphate-sugar epimerase